MPHSCAPFAQEWETTLIAQWALLFTPRVPQMSVRKIKDKDLTVQPRKAESHNASSSASHFSKSVRSGAPPVIFRPMSKDKPALYFPVNVAHPPVTLIDDEIQRGRIPADRTSQSLRHGNPHTAPAAKGFKGLLGDRRLKVA